MIAVMRSCVHIGTISFRRKKGIDTISTSTRPTLAEEQVMYSKRGTHFEEPRKGFVDGLSWLSVLRSPVQENRDGEVGHRDIGLGFGGDDGDRVVFVGEAMDGQYYGLWERGEFTTRAQGLESYVLRAPGEFSDKEHAFSVAAWKEVTLNEYDVEFRRMRLTLSQGLERKELRLFRPDAETLNPSKYTTLYLGQQECLLVVLVDRMSFSLLRLNYMLTGAEEGRSLRLGLMPTKHREVQDFAFDMQAEDTEELAFNLQQPRQPTLIVLSVSGRGSKEELWQLNYFLIDGKAEQESEKETIWLERPEIRGCSKFGFTNVAYHSGLELLIVVGLATQFRGELQLDGKEKGFIYIAQYRMELKKRVFKLVNLMPHKTLVWPVELRRGSVPRLTGQSYEGGSKHRLFVAIPGSDYLFSIKLYACRSDPRLFPRFTLLHQPQVSMNRIAGYGPHSQIRSFTTTRRSTADGHGEVLGLLLTDENKLIRLRTL